MTRDASAQLDEDVLTHALERLEAALRARYGVLRVHVVE